MKCFSLKQWEVIKFKAGKREMRFTHSFMAVGHNIGHIINLNF